jgi:uncharacterized protein
MIKPPAPEATTRRETLQMAGQAAVAGSVVSLAPAKGQAMNSKSTLSFPEVTAGLDATHHVSEGHSAQVLLRWGDALFDDSPKFDPRAQTPAKQMRQFGYDNDFIGFMPLPLGSKSSNSGLLCINHEMVHSELMLPGLMAQYDKSRPRAMAEVEMAAQGHTIVEVARVNGTWTVKTNSPYNRRISPLETVMELTGPAAGHRRLKTSDDATGRKVIGTMANCAGSETLWGTVMIAEENIQHYFGGDYKGTPEEANHREMGLMTEVYFNWNEYYPRFDLQREPNEPNRFGWMVEIDPYDPKSTPKKRTALGRCKHEGVGFALTPDKRVAVYSGDDEVFQFIYRFVSSKPLSADREKNRDILDDGILSVARFNDDQTLTWLPLVWGQGPLTSANGFADQGEVLIETRRAARLLGATPMDRPEEVVPNPVTGTVFATLTKNSKRTKADAANPRVNNRHGHVLEMLPPGFDSGSADHAATTYRWRPFIIAGDPRLADSGAQYHADVSQLGWFSNPDNIAFDPQGRIWLSTDGSGDFGRADGLWAADVSGPGRALSRRFFTCPLGAELTGPCFTPDGTTLFVSVQHPGESDGSNFQTPSTRWPDFADGIPPRPSVVVVQRPDGKPIT